MRVTEVPANKLDYDPWEEDCCGSHPGDSIVIDCGDGLVFTLQEHPSGIGPEFKASVALNGSQGRHLASFWLSDDDGSLETQR